MKKINLIASALFVALSTAASTVNIHVTGPAKSISPDLFGIFFEDINYAADGGLYGELVQNRSFEYDATEQPTWGPLTGWDFIQRGGGAGDLWVDSSYPIHPNNRHCALLRVRTVGEGVGLSNAGFDGIAVKAGEKFDFSIFARMLNVGDGRNNKPAGKLPLSVRLETKEGAMLGEASVEASDLAEWKQLTATITSSQTVADARLVVLAKAPGLIALDEISLFPQGTFKGRKNGLRADLAQVIADLHPKFIRFPGGCLAHGDGIGNIYRWKDTIGPVEQRKGQANIWRYHQSAGLGYFEYFQFCEDIGAKPLPVLAAGVSCQNSTRTRGTGQQYIPMADMPGYVQEVLDLIEWANGPATSTWGAKRAVAGHPEPFHLEYLGVGNEDKITAEFKERFKMIYDAVREKHPEISVVGTVGPAPDGEDFAKGWQLAGELRIPTVDEHYYKSPEWFWDNLQRYDRYDRANSKVYLGEYAASERNRVNTLRTALAEAAYMTSLERNGDVVRLSSYAPLLAREGHTQWHPDMIYFNGTSILLTPNYYAQQMFSCNQGDVYLPAAVSGGDKTFAASCVRDTKSGDVILKFVNTATNAIQAQVTLPELGSIRSRATCIVLSGDAMAANSWKNPNAIVPTTNEVAVSPSFVYEASANSVTVIRLKTR